MTGPVERHDEIGSTQDRAHRLAEAGAAEGTTVVAARQDHGRGTRGRHWVAETGGLWLSVVGRPASAERLERLSVRVGICLASAIEQAVGLPRRRIQLKWPNDLVLDDRKLGGILCEARWHGEQPAWVVVGIGINVRNPLPAAAAYPATRLADHGSDVDPGQLVTPAIQAVLEALGRPGDLTTAELAEFEGRDWLAGRRIAAGPGTVVGLQPDGWLSVRRDDGSVVPGPANLTWADLAPEPGSR